MTLHWGPRSGRVVVMGFGKKGISWKVLVIPSPWSLQLALWKRWGSEVGRWSFLLRWLFWKVLWYAMFASRVGIIYNQIIPFGDIYYQHIYWVTTRHAYNVVNYVSMGAYPGIFFYPSSLWKYTTCVLKDMGLLPPEVPQTETSWAQLETTGSHWFPCGVGVNPFYIVYPDVVSGTFHPALKKQAGTPRSTSFHQRLGRLKGDLFLFCCLIVLMWGWSILGRCIENVGVDEMGWSSGSKIL